MGREWYVYVPVHKLVLSGYMTETDAREEASRVLREWPEAAPFEVLHRSHLSIQEYARTHPAWAKREGFAGSPSTISSQAEPKPWLLPKVESAYIVDHLVERGLCVTHGYSVSREVPCPQFRPSLPEERRKEEWREAWDVGFGPVGATPPHACPLCPETVAGGPDEYLGHIRTEHPGEWRRLETYPGYTLRPQRAVVPLSEEERVREVAMWALDLLREKGPMTDQEISAQLDVPLERVSKVTDNLMSEGKIEWEALTGKYRYCYFPPKVVLPVEAGIMRCRFCGAPYAYSENLELHEKSCPRRAGYGG